MQRLLALLGVGTLLLTGCATGDGTEPVASPSESETDVPTPDDTPDDDQPDDDTPDDEDRDPTASPSPTASDEGTPTPTATPDGGPALAASCTNSELAVTIAYPDGWSTNDGGVLPACSVFDPAPFELEEGTEIPLGLAVVVQGSDRQFATYVDADDQPGTRELERRETTVDGHDAVAMLLEATEDAPLLEPGTRLYRWVIDTGVDEMTAVSTLLLVSYDRGEPAFDQKRRTLDAMVRQLELPAGDA